jgi:hypothetical protein
MALLANASVSFRTNDENKDHDTNVTVEVRDNVGELVARVSDTFGPFDDQTSNGPFQLEVLNRVEKSTVQNGNVLIRIDPKGDDTWRFNFIVKLHFDDGSTLIASADGVELNEHEEQQQTFGIV